MNDTDSINNLYQIIQEQSEEHPYNNRMKEYKWGYNEDKWSEERIVSEIKRLENKIKELEDADLKGQVNQNLLNMYHRGVQHLRALRAKNLKAKIANKR